jgi:chromosome segregation ATPase
MPPLTLDQLSNLVENLQKDLVDTQKKVSLLEAEVKQYRQDYLELEQQLSQSITTQQLVVTGNAQISSRDILADGQMLDTHEQKLSSHDGILSTHQTDITLAQNTANNAVTRASNAQDTANDAVTRANNAQNAANTAQDMAAAADQKAAAAQSTASNVKSSVAPLVSSTVLREFISLVEYKVRRDGMRFFVFPSLHAWDVYANGQFYSGHGFVSNKSNDL